MIKQFSGSISAKLITGRQVLDIGFRPTLLVFLSRTDTYATVNSRFMLGVATYDEATNSYLQWCSFSGEDNAVNPANAYHGFSDNAAILAYTNSTTERAKAKVVGIGETSVTLQWDTVPSSGFTIQVFATDSIYAKAGTLDLNAATGLQSITGISFDPTALLFSNTKANTTIGAADHSAISIGMATGPASQFVNAMSGKDAVTPTVEKSIYLDNKCVARLDELGALQAAASLSSLDVGGFTLDVTTAPPAAMKVGYLAIGNVPAAIVNIDSPPTTDDYVEQPLPFVGITALSSWISNVSTPGVVRAGGRFGFGMSITDLADNGREWGSALSTYSSDAVSTSAAKGYQDSDALLSINSAGSIETEGSITLSNADNYIHVDWWYVSATSQRFPVMVLANSVFVGSDVNTYDADLSYPIPDALGALDIDKEYPLPTLAASLLIGSLFVAQAGGMAISAPALSADMVVGNMLSADLKFPLPSGAGYYGDNVLLDYPLPSLMAEIIVGGTAGARLIQPLPSLEATLSPRYDYSTSAAAPLPMLSASLIAEGLYAGAGMFPAPRMSASMLCGSSLDLDADYPLPSVHATLIASLSYEASLAIELPSLRASMVPAAELSGSSLSGDALVFNTRGGGLTLYKNFGFNSFAVIGGRIFAASGNGLFELTGKLDQAAPIAANAKTGLLDFGSPQIKRNERCYVAYRTDGDMVMRVSADEGDAYEYPLESRGSEGLHGVRVKIGKGLKGRYFQMELANLDGAGFDCDGIDFQPLVTDRKIKT